MASILATQTIVGTIGSVYELRTVGAENRKVIDFSVAVTRKKKDGDDWKDGETYWVTVTAWNFLAENIEKSFKKGDRVMVIGYTDMKPGYTTENGEERPAKPILIAEFAGHEVTYAPSTQHREPRQGKTQSNDRQRPAANNREAAPAKKTAPAKRPPAPSEDSFTFDDDFSKLDDYDFDSDSSDMDAPPF